jgi:hypothetical protein
MAAAIVETPLNCCEVVFSMAMTFPDEAAGRTCWHIGSAKKCNLDARAKVRLL